MKILDYLFDKILKTVDLMYLVVTRNTPAVYFPPSWKLDLMAHISNEKYKYLEKYKYVFFSL